MRRNLAILLLALCGVPAAAQEKRDGDVKTTVKVEVVQLDVLALDSKDRPVLDLTADDFVVKIAGKPQTLEGFDPPRRKAARAALQSGQPAQPGQEPAASAAPALPEAGASLHVLFLVDLEELPARGVMDTGKQALAAISEMQGSPRISVVEHFGRNAELVWEEPSVDRVEAAFLTLAEAPSASASESISASGMHGFEQRESGGGTRSFEDRQRTEDRLIQDITDAEAAGARPGQQYAAFSQYLKMERERVKESVEELRATLEKFAALGDVRQAVLYTQGFERIPGSRAVALLDRLEYLKDQSGEGRGGTIPHTTSGAQPFGLPGDVPPRLRGRIAFDASPLIELDRLETWLASCGVMLHMVDPSAGLADTPSAEHGFAANERERGVDRAARQEGVARLVEATGGTVHQRVIGNLPEAFSASYRLAVRVSDIVPGKPYKVAVSVKRKGVRVLSRSAFTSAAPGGAQTAAVTRAQTAVEQARQDQRRPGAGRKAAATIPLVLAWKGKKGPDPDDPNRQLYVLEVKVPYDALRFEPQEDAMVASATITVSPLPLSGTKPEASSEDVFLSLSGEEYKAARGTDLVKTLRIGLPPGRYELSVAIEDALGKSAGLARLTVDAEK